MKTLGIIPARGGSKSLPWKNIKNLAGKPLIAYSIEAALKSNLDRVIVSTDADRIAKVARDYDSEVIMRPPELARDDIPTLPVLQHVVANLGEKFDCVVTLQPTSPLRTAKHIDEALELFESDPEANSLVSIIHVPHNMNPYSIMELKDGYLTNYIEQDELLLRRQDKPEFYARNGAAIYITSILQIHKYVFGGKILPYFMDALESIDIDTEEDFLLAKQYVNQ